MTASAAVRALVVEDDQSLIGEYRQVLCANGTVAPELDQPFGAFERDLIGAAIGHQHFPRVEIVAFQVGEEAAAAVRDAVDGDDPFLVAFVDSELKAGLGGIETAERIRAADARMQIVMMAGRSPLHPIEMVARVPPADRLSFVKKPFHPFEIQHILIGCRQRILREGWEKSQRLAQPGGRHPSILQEILDRIPAGVLVFDRHDQLVVANAELRRIFPDLADIFVPGVGFHDVRRQMKSEGPAVPGPSGGAQVWRHGESRWAVVTERVAPTGETYCLVCDITEHKHRDAARCRALHSVRLTQVFSGLCGTIDRLFAKHAAGQGVEPVMARLRTVARQQHLTSRAIDLGKYLGRAARRIRRSLPNGIGLEAVFDSGLWPVAVDPDGLARALAELTANACDAMAGGGRIILEADNVRVSARSEVAALGLAAGDYVRVTVQDTGKGMLPEVVDQALIPFQSGADGQHIGVGLPIVHAFAIESGGWLDIEGGAGSGAAVRLYLPRMRTAVDAAAVGNAAAGEALAPIQAPPPRRRTGTAPSGFDPDQSP